MSEFERETFDVHPSREFRELASIAFPKSSYALKRLKGLSGPFHKQSATDRCDLLLWRAGVGDSVAKRRTGKANGSLSYGRMVLEEVEGMSQI